VKGAPGGPFDVSEELGDGARYVAGVVAEVGGATGDAAVAAALDASDVLARFRARFHLPLVDADDAASGEALYFVGNSLGERSCACRPPPRPPPSLPACAAAKGLLLLL